MPFVPPPASLGRVTSVNVGLPRATRWQGRLVRSAIWKEPVDGRVAIRGTSLVGDDQADHRVHGGELKAVYAYASEDIAWWERELGRSLGSAPFGENLTLAGVDLVQARIGERWRFGSALLEIVGPRVPCFKLAMRHADPELPERFRRAGRAGAYWRVVAEGEVGAGDPASQVGAAPDGAPTLLDAFRLMTGTEVR